MGVVPLKFACLFLHVTEKQLFHTAKVLLTGLTIRSFIGGFAPLL